MSSLKIYHPTLHLTPWSLDLFIRVPFQLSREHTVLQTFWRIELFVHISVLPGTHFPLRLRGETHAISLKSMQLAGFETARQAATSVERHALTIAPCPSPNVCYHVTNELTLSMIYHSILAIMHTL